MNWTGPEARRSIVALTALLAAGCGLPEGEFFGKVDDSPDPTTLRWCNSGEPEHVDPALVTSTTGTPLARLMFAGLADFDTNMEGTSIPSLASDWVVSPDLRTFTFNLRRDAKWSNGRPITAHDFVYHVARILHPTTISRNVDPLEPVKNAALYTPGRVKMVMADSPPFRKGDIVEVIGTDGNEANREDLSKIPNSNKRKSSKPIKLRDMGAGEGESYRTVPAGADIQIVEQAGEGDSWTYIYWDGDGEWVYGWAPTKEVDIEPNAAVNYTVREVPPNHRPRTSLKADPSLVLRKGTVVGAKLLMIPEVLGLYAKDDYTFVVETSTPTPHLIGDVAGRGFRPTPRESVSRSPKRWTKPEDGLLVTSGPFTMTEWRERDKMVFKKAPNFIHADKVKIETFVSYNMNDQAASANLYFQGGCDAVTEGNIPYTYLPALSGRDRDGRAYEDYINAPKLGIYYYLINTEKFTNVHLRRALSHAVDRRPIPGLIHGGEIPTASFTTGRRISSLSEKELEQCGLTKDTPGVALFVTPELCYVPPRGADFDLDKAKAELALAKEQMGADFPSSVELKFNTGVESHKLIAEYFQDQWKRNLDIDVKLQVQEWKTYLKDTSAGNYQIARLGWIVSAPQPESSYMIVFQCQDGKPKPFNRSRWCSDEFDSVFKKAQEQTDLKKRLELVRQAEEIMIEAQPIIPIYVYTQKHLRKPYLRDMPLQLGDQTAIWRTWIDADWKKSRAAKKAAAK